jgi:hypothetical protein
LRGRASRWALRFKERLNAFAHGRPSYFHEVATVFKACAGTDRAWILPKANMALVKKREARKSVHQSGWITLEGGFAARQCVVQDMSSTGAKITVDDSSALPARLRLAFTRDARTGRNCNVVWRRGKSLGVKFVR